MRYPFVLACNTFSTTPLHILKSFTVDIGISTSWSKDNGFQGFVMKIQNMH